MSVITIRVKPDTKKTMGKCDIQWSREIRAYIERRIAEEERKSALTKTPEGLWRYSDLNPAHGSPSMHNSVPSLQEQLFNRNGRIKVP